MRINADFTQRVVIRPDDYEWTPSPIAGVERMMLDRIGGEVARATSLVRYVPNSMFSAHTHTGGEEFFVLEGVFADEHDNYPAGTYVRNPIGTAHTPKIGPQGALIFVKLHQFDPGDTQAKSIDTQKAKWEQGREAGVEVLELHHYGEEEVMLVRIAPHTKSAGHDHPGGEEIFVLEGTSYDEEGAYPKGTWIRNPPGSHHRPHTREDGALVFIKSGHLNTIKAPA